jgi:hypothetical protein
LVEKQNVAKLRVATNLMYDPSILTIQLPSKNMPSTSDDYEREI